MTIHTPYDAKLIEKKWQDKWQTEWLQWLSWHNQQEKRMGGNNSCISSPKLYSRDSNYLF